MPLDFAGPTRSPERRIEEARKLLELLCPVYDRDVEGWAPKDADFFVSVSDRVDRNQVPSEKSIAWLRDLVERYI